MKVAQSTPMLSAKLTFFSRTVSELKSTRSFLNLCANKAMTLDKAWSIQFVEIKPDLGTDSYGVSVLAIDQDHLDQAAKIIAEVAASLTEMLAIRDALRLFREDETCE